jgi:Domain of unknown function (DUF4226)
VTQPSVETAQSGEAADAVRTLQAELSSDYSEIRSAEIQLTDAILTAHAVTVAGRARLQDIQRQLIEAINNPATALDTPSGERQFLLFLRSRIAEIQDIVDTGALTDEDHAKLTRALGSGYLLPGPEAQHSAPAATSDGTTMADQGAGMLPAVGSALGALPQAAQGAATAPAQGAGGLAGAATPLAGLASGLLERTGERDLVEGPIDEVPTSDEAEADDVDESPETGADTEDDDTDDHPTEPLPPSDREPPEDGPAQTRPARLM